jgi:2'-5' RNA ligase
MRVFIAVELNDEARAYLGEQTRRLTRALPSVRWVDPASLHLTLAFLGEVDGEQLALATAASATVAATARPFVLRLASLGHFGPAGAPRVIWTGLSGNTAALQTLQQRLAAELAARGFALDERPFTPHLTLARVKYALKPAEVVVFSALLAQQASRSSAAPWLPVDRIVVMRSELFRAGARYTMLSAHPFGGSSPASDSIV